MFTSITHHLHRRALFAILSNIQAGKLTLTMPDGETREFLGPNDGPSADMQITHRRTVARVPPQEPTRRATSMWKDTWKQSIRRPDRYGNTIMSRPRTSRLGSPM